MRREPPGSPTFWQTVVVLLRASRTRSSGRRQRQQALLQNREGDQSSGWSAFGSVFTVVLMLGLNVAAAFVLSSAVEAGQRLEIERQGKIVVSQEFYLHALDAKSRPATAEGGVDALDYFSEARSIEDRYGGSSAEIARELRASVVRAGAGELVSEADASPGLAALSQFGVFPEMFGSIVLLWWAAMLVFQGEGLELDLQRRRHPIWEWLFSHPVPQGAVFLAEMLSPIAANPLLLGAPLFVGFVYGWVYGAPMGMVAAAVVGLPVMAALACVGKALEVNAVLRLAPRSRGAVVGLMSWLGFVSMMLFFIGWIVTPRVASAIGSHWLGTTLTVLPWPWLRWFLGGSSHGFSFTAGVLTCWLSAGAAIAGSVWLSVWSTEQGLSGKLGAEDTTVSSRKGRTARFGKEPLYRKEMLWFLRDRSAIVQVVLVPATVAGAQLLNFHQWLSQAQSAWNYICGVAIVFGTYFLWVLGPKSLASEGSALWIALTWPRGLESLLKAKAWLWSAISTALVSMLLVYAAVLYPASTWKVLLVGIGWFAFSRSMAEKTVTLVSVPSSSGEKQPIPRGRQWAAQLGMLTFSIGILTQQWQLAVVGIVYSYLTSAAMWQNFRARLPFLYDPWSERLPEAPTLMHAMVAISILLESTAILMGALATFTGAAHAGAALAISYGISAVGVCIGASVFLSERNVRLRDVWRWEDGPTGEIRPWWNGRADILRSVSAVLLGAGGGVVLGLFGSAYGLLLRHLPATEELVRKSQQKLAAYPDLRMFYFIMAVFFAPFAEEYLFRGLLYRALDREWGGWPAVLGSAAFFAIYHPPLSWLPVFLLGTINALLFKKTRQLGPAVMLHMVYNAIVLW